MLLAREERAVDEAKVVGGVVLLDPVVGGREEPAGIDGLLLLRGLLYFLRGFVRLRRAAVEEIEVVHERQRLEREDRRDVWVVNRDQVVAIYLLTRQREVRRATVHHRILAVESANDELVMHLVSEPHSGHLIERRRQFGRRRLSRNERPGFLARHVDEDAARRV